MGLAKTHLQHLITAVALNVVRLGEWWLGTPPAKTRCDAFAALRMAAAESGLGPEFATSIKDDVACNARVAIPVPGAYRATGC
jgi:hypothetical protein